MLVGHIPEPGRTDWLQMYAIAAVLTMAAVSLLDCNVECHTPLAPALSTQRARPETTRTSLGRAAANVRWRLSRFSCVARLIDLLA